MKKIHSHEDLFFIIHDSQEVETTQISKNCSGKQRVVCLHVEGYSVINSGKLRQTAGPSLLPWEPGGHPIDTCRGWPAPLQAPAATSVSGSQEALRTLVKGGSTSITYSGPRCLQSLFSPRWKSPQLRAPLPGPPYTGHPPIRHRCYEKQPTAYLKKLPGSRLGFSPEERELGVLVILESSFRVRGVSPPRSVVLASESAEVRMGLAWGAAPLGKKARDETDSCTDGGGGGLCSGMTISAEKGSPRPLPTVSGRPLSGSKGCFLGLLGLPCNQGGLGTQYGFK